jgi:indolepyruvate ferredoxin oxidoreductase
LNWTGIAPFTSAPHVFQNLGDGTYFHSGLLAIRGAVAANVNITYKILYNDAVAMTGGQPVEGQLTPVEIARQLLAERVRRVVIVSDDPAKYRGGALRPPSDVTVHHRDELARLQQEFRALRGVTAIIYEQTCAAEKRRRRKRGQAADTPVRMFINDAVCEGCGDCSVQSNCVSILPKETALGRKREIDQSSCNKDFSCANGFCPSFVSVHGGALRRPPPRARTLPDVPAPRLQPESCNVLVAGIGGTGVVTVGAVLAMAAHLDGRRAAAVDMTGLAQKNGAVWSHLRIGALDDAATPPSSRLGFGEIDVLLACDVVAATDGDVRAALDPTRTRVVANASLQPTAHFQASPDLPMTLEPYLAALSGAVAREGIRLIDATSAAEALLGSALGGNFLLVGAALQSGALRLSLPAVERAIELNGQGVAMNRAALTLGRLAVHDRATFDALLHAAQRSAPRDAPPPTLEALVEDRVARLTEYQNRAYAARYRTLVERVRSVERERLGDTRLTHAVARNYYKLLAYKDEYEVARQLTSTRFREQIAATFEGDFTLHFHLAPSFLVRPARHAGVAKKREFGPWIASAFRVLATGRHLRGSWLDPFGWQHERRLERRLIKDYEQLIDELLDGLAPDTGDAALILATWPDAVRGFGHVKERSLELLQTRVARERETFRAHAGRVAATGVPSDV